MKNSILDVVHQTATGLRKSEAVTDGTKDDMGTEPKGVMGSRVM